MIVAAEVSAAKPWTGSSLMTCVPIVLMIRQPPAAVPSAIGRRGSSMTRAGTTNSSDHAGGEQRQRHDAHRLLRVVAAMAERHERRRHHLQVPEAVVHDARP